MNDGELLKSPTYNTATHQVRVSTEFALYILSGNTMCKDDPEMAAECVADAVFRSKGIDIPSYARLYVGYQEATDDYMLTIEWYERKRK